MSGFIITETCILNPIICTTCSASLLLISQDYFEENLRGIYDEDEFTLSEEYSYKGYVKTVPEDELLVDFDDECEYKNSSIWTI